jgi:hypothetical protein
MLVPKERYVMEEEDEEEAPLSSYGTDSEDPYYNAWFNGFDPYQEDPNNGILEKVEWQKEGF